MLQYGGKILSDGYTLADYNVGRHSTLHLSGRLLGGAGGEASSSTEQDNIHFFSSTKPLRVWFDARNFRYAIRAYQRKYEWDTGKAKGLLKSIQDTMPGGVPPGVLKLSEVVVHQKPPDKGKEVNVLVLDKHFMFANDAINKQTGCICRNSSGCYRKLIGRFCLLEVQLAKWR